jgi:hypothetical protein
LEISQLLNDGDSLFDCVDENYEAEPPQPQEINSGHADDQQMAKTSSSGSDAVLTQQEQEQRIDEPSAAAPPPPPPAGNFWLVQPAAVDLKSKELLAKITSCFEKVQTAHIELGMAIENFNYFHNFMYNNK